MSATLCQSLSEQELSLLLDIARNAVREYISDNKPHYPDPSQYAEALARPGACFVTLKVDGALQGCLGSILPRSPLVCEVYNKARSSCYEDTRFIPLTRNQLDSLTVEVSVLSEPVRQNITSERELKAFLTTNKVGLILSDKYHRALFLPQVWEQLPNPDDFIHHLKIKAGWSPNYWSDDIRVETFIVSSIQGDYQ